MFGKPVGASAQIAGTTFEAYPSRGGALNAAERSRPKASVRAGNGSTSEWVETLEVDPSTAPSLQCPCYEPRWDSFRPDALAPRGWERRCLDGPGMEGLLPMM